jgi:hypothetical protein
VRKTLYHMAGRILPLALGVAVFSPFNVAPSLANGDNYAFCAKADVSVAPLPGGRMQLSAQSTCLANSRVRIEYAGFQFAAAFDVKGRLEYALDCFAGDKSNVHIVFPNGESDTKDVTTRDLEQVTKVAVVWRGAVNLDLHALEYTAAPHGPGHVWQTTPSSMREAAANIWADGRGHGFMSATSAGSGVGDQLEVYTFLHAKNQNSGVVKMVLDYASRFENPPNKEACGSGLYSELEYQVFILAHGKLSKTSGVFNAAPCGEALEDIKRYNAKAVPSLFMR